MDKLGLGAAAAFCVYAFTVMNKYETAWRREADATHYVHMFEDTVNARSSQQYRTAAQEAQAKHVALQAYMNAGTWWRRPWQEIPPPVQKWTDIEGER